MPLTSPTTRRRKGSSCMKPLGAHLRAPRHEHFDRIDISWLFPPNEDEPTCCEPMIGDLTAAARTNRCPSHRCELSSARKVGGAQ
jgi:hypothetical protein